MENKDPTDETISLKNFIIESQYYGLTGYVKIIEPKHRGCPLKIVEARPLFLRPILFLSNFTLLTNGGTISIPVPSNQHNQLDIVLTLEKLFDFLWAKPIAFCLIFFF